MKKIKKNEQEKILKIVKKHKKKLLLHPGVANIGVGYTMTKGKINEEEFGIVVFVAKKFPESELQPGEVMPKQLEGIKVDIIEINPVEHSPYNVFQNLIGGISISNSNLTGGGTLGVLLKDNETNQPVGLTNWHVIKNKTGKIGDAIVQPAWKPSSSHSIGNLLRWDLNLDCAIFSVNQNRSVNRIDNLYNIPGKVRSTIQNPLIGTRVVKSGARTGVTYGIINFISHDLVDITITANPDKPALNNEISRPGDSGSFWVTDNASPLAIALHWGGDGENTPKDEFAYTKNANFVFKKLNVSLLS